MGISSTGSGRVCNQTRWHMGANSLFMHATLNNKYLPTEKPTIPNTAEFINCQRKATTPTTNVFKTKVFTPPHTACTDDPGAMASNSRP